MNSLMAPVAEWDQVPVAVVAAFDDRYDVVPIRCFSFAPKVAVLGLCGGKSISFYEVKLLSAVDRVEIKNVFTCGEIIPKKAKSALQWNHPMSLFWTSYSQNRYPFIFRYTRGFPLSILPSASNGQVR